MARSTRRQSYRGGVSRQSVRVWPNASEDVKYAIKHTIPAALALSARSVAPVHSTESLLAAEFSTIVRQRLAMTIGMVT